MHPFPTSIAKLPIVETDDEDREKKFIAIHHLLEKFSTKEDFFDVGDRNQ
ncbi:hypothetical protein H6F77_16930 [Microcoleus sp. FACHB-831]|nr:hypothetical protein [Microcoleus sp. FACHB-831]MBD1922740.1 hypothetical protein [Microcoleus sp. FACHB-831]